MSNENGRTSIKIFDVYYLSLNFILYNTDVVYCCIYVYRPGNRKMKRIGV